MPARRPEPLTESDREAMVRIIKERIMFGEDPDWSDVTDYVDWGIGGRPSKQRVYAEERDRAMQEIADACVEMLHKSLENIR